MENTAAYWDICPDCKGRGKKSRRLRKKIKLKYQQDVAHYKKSGGNGKIPVRPKGHLDPCKTCKGSGLLSTENPPLPDTENYPHVAIIGGGIGGTALAVACLHRGIPFTLYEWDKSFNARSQGYGLTLQQASKAMVGFGIFHLDDGVVSTRHLVHNTDGKVIGEWGMRKWLQNEGVKAPKKTNIHIARQSLRLALLKQLGGSKAVTWGHQLVDLKEIKGEGVELSFQVNGELKKTRADLVVGADGIRSQVRNLSIGEEVSPLRYLDCMVILGICSLDELEDIESELLDSATVFQTANGKERIYMMPFSKNEIMWQLSFPVSEKNAIALNKKGPEALKEEAVKRTQWHDPIPQILAATNAEMVSGYPVYDRALLQPELLENAGAVTLLGDAAHPMSPFKGQGANQALLDALALAREIYKGCRPQTNWKEKGVREAVLNIFEAEMLERSATKVKDSAAAADFLHSEIVLEKADSPRGRSLK